MAILYRTGEDVPGLTLSPYIEGGADQRGAWARLWLHSHYLDLSLDEAARLADELRDVIASA